jgi:hypothetical protein
VSVIANTAILTTGKLKAPSFQRIISDGIRFHPVDHKPEIKWEWLSAGDKGSWR